VHVIDRYAYSNRLRRVDPAYKAGLAFTVLLLCLLLNEPVVGLVAVGWMVWLAVRLAGLSLSSSPDSLYRGLTLVTRALGAASAMNFLALTTPLVDLVELFRRWRVPAVLIDIMTVIYRFIFVLLESLDRMFMAQESRLGYNTSYLRAINNAALLGSRLFIDAYQRSRRLQLALESRGFEGELRVLPARYESGRQLMWPGLGITASLILVWMIG
jgi:cobalt/nickel transport system permease protein